MGFPGGYAEADPRVFGQPGPVMGLILAGCAGNETSMLQCTCQGENMQSPCSSESALVRFPDYEAALAVTCINDTGAAGERAWMLMPLSGAAQDPTGAAAAVQGWPGTHHKSLHEIHE